MQPSPGNAFLAALVETSHDAMFGVDLDGAIRSWNPAARLLFGYDADEILGKSVAIFAPPDRPGEPLDFLARVLAGETVHAETQRMRKDGSRFDAVVSISPIRDAAGRVTGAAGTIRDITRRKLAEARLLTEHAIARVLAEATSITQAMPQILQAVCRITGWEWGALWRPADEGADAALRCELTWSQAQNPSDVAAFDSASRGTTLPAGIGLPGRVFAAGKPAWVADISTDANFPRHDAAVALGLHGALCFPISWAGRTLGVMEFFSRRVKEPDEPLLGMMTVVGGQIGQFIDRRQSVRALKASEARNAAVLAAALDCIVAMDHRGLVIEWNPAAERTFGYTRAEAIGREMAELIIPPALRDNHRAGLARYLATGRYVLIDRRLEIIAMRKSGEIFPVELTITRIPSDGPPTFTGFLRDITERQRSEAELRESEERLRLAIAIAQMGTFQIDLLTDVVTVNDTGRAMYGWTPDEPLTFAKVQTHFHPADRKHVIETVAGSFRPGGSGGFELEQRIIRTDGGTRWIRVRGRTIFDEARDPANSDAGTADAPRALRCVGTYIDITEQKQAEQEREQLLTAERISRTEAERASHMKDEFLATLSHELRTPLNAILGWATILRSDAGAGAPEDLEHGLETIERNARAQTQIIEDLLDMSRIISGKVRLDVQRVDLAEVARSAIETVRPAAQAKGIRLQPILDPLAAKVSGDPNRLQQVLWNLLSNAIKFTPKGGRVQVVLERVNSHLELSVSDTGEGIRPEFLAHVFDRFRQGDASTTRQHGGLGLGLAIAKQLVELHGGTVRAKSPGAGQGATFTVVLPLSVLHPDIDAQTDDEPQRRHPHSPAAGPVAVPDQCAGLAGVRVLVVDDEPDARNLVRRLLEDCDAVVMTAASADEALARVRQERPDVLVSDIGMPGEDGYSLIRRVRALGPGHGGSTPAVALTAYARAEDRMRSVLAGFQMHVAKPVEPAELITMVASLAGRTGTFTT